MSKGNWSHRTRALANIGWVVLAVVLCYLKAGAPYFTRKQADDYTMRQSLAGNMEILEIITVPEGSGSWSEDSGEWVYLLRYEDTVAVMLTKENHGFSYVQEYPDRDGMAVLPLYGLGNVNGLFDGLAVGVIPTNPEIVSVDVTFCTGDAPPAVISTQEVSDGVFMANCENVGEYLIVSVTDTLTTYNYVGAIGYDEEGNVIAQTKSVLEERYEAR